MSDEKKPVKQHEADETAARLLSLQLTSSRGTKAGDGALTALFLAVIFLFAALFWILPDRAVSERENRALASLPVLSAKSVMDGDFAGDVAEYMADQFPFRDFFVSVNALWDRMLLRGGHNGILFGEGGVLIPREDLPDLTNLQKNTDAMRAFSAYAEKRGIPSLTAVTGRTADVLSHTLPDYYGEAYSDRLWQAIRESDGDALLLRDPLRDRAEAGQYVYYRTDHHWTSLGAFYGAADILSALGQEILPPSAYTREAVSDAFYGTAWSKAGAFWVQPDVMEFFRYEGDGDFVTVIEDDGTSFAGFYDRSYLDGRDQYSAFLSGNHGLVTVTKNAGSSDRPRMLLIKDSFAHAAVPFLAQVYDLVIVDLRYYKQVPAKLLTEYEIDQILFLYNAATLTDSASQRLLTVGLE